MLLTSIQASRDIEKSSEKAKCSSCQWFSVFTRQSFLILVIPLLLCSTIDANAHVSSQSTTTVHQTKHILNIIYGTGTADNAPDPCVPSSCYMSAYLHAFRLHTIYPTQPFDAGIIAMVGLKLRLSRVCRPYRMDSQPSFSNQYHFWCLFGRD
jgi:hypothetical protein